MRFSTDIVKKDRKRTVLTNFRGVDASSPVYAVATNRASAMVNFINKDGSNHKRNGWRQIARIKDADGNGLGINGYFKFEIANKFLRVVYAGTKFFIFDDATNEQLDVTNNIDNTRLKNRPVQMFVDNDKAYFIGMGDFLVLGVYDGELQFRRVYNDENTHIPTTTVNISPEETDYYEDGQVVEYGARQTFRDVNIFNAQRKNTLIGSDYYMNAGEGEEVTLPVTRTYHLDGKNLDVSPFSIVARDYVEATGEQKEYVLTAVQDLDDDSTTTRALRNTDAGVDLAGMKVKFSAIKSIKTLGYEENGRYMVIKANNFLVYATPTDANANHAELYMSESGVETKLATAKRYSDTQNYYITWLDGYADFTHIIASTGNFDFVTQAFSGEDGWKITVEGLKARKYLVINEKISEDVPDISAKTCENARVWGVMDFDEGIISLQVHPKTIQGEANIEVTFAQEDSEYANRILDCRFATLFGASGNANTLFVGGNDKYPNYDYWSVAEDFTYFPSGNLCALGTSSTKVMGYQRLGDESLAIFKEDSVTEPTLYIRTGVATKIDESTSSVTEGYYLTVGKYITQGVVSSDCIGMLNGDALFLSKQGVYGVQINSDSIAVEQRVAKERSRLINSLLAKHSDLSRAVSIVYDNKFYIAIDEYVYIADARFVFTQKGDMADTYNYEWWVWDNCPVRRFFILDNALCFGTNDGRVCMFDDEFTDRKYEALNTVNFDLEGNRIAHDGQVEMADGDFMLLRGNVHRLLFDSNQITLVTDGADTRLQVSEADILKLYTGQKVFADTITGFDIAPNIEYFVTDIDLASCSFVLAREDGSRIAPTGTFRLLCDINNEVVRVKTENENGVKYLSIYKRKTYTDLDGNVVDERYVLATYNGTPIQAEAIKVFMKNVVSKWYTPAMDMGASDYIKQMTRLTVATEQITDGKIQFGWETKNANGLREIDAKGLDVFDFNNLDFGKFTFDTGFESAFTRTIKASFNYIVFRFVSDNDCDSCVHSLTVEYKVNRANKGVW